MSTATYVPCDYETVRAAMLVDWPELEHGAARLRRIEVSQRDAEMSGLRAMFDGHSRGRIKAGTYTGLYINGGLWMSDTDDEQRDHLDFVYAAGREQARRVLINGLGLGMVVRSVCHLPTVESVDVVDNHPDVIALVGPLVERYGADHGVTVRVHQGDAHNPADTFAPVERWDAAWHDIWQHITAENWESMKTVRRRHGRRVGMQMEWCARETRQAVERERRDRRWSR